MLLLAMLPAATVITAFFVLLYLGKNAEVPEEYADDPLSLPSIESIPEISAEETVEVSPGVSMKIIEQFKSTKNDIKEVKSEVEVVQ